MADLESERLAAETRKWVAEELKFGAEREKLFQEALKLERERWWYVPLALVGSNALAAVIGVIVARVIH